MLTQVSGPCRCCDSPHYDFLVLTVIYFDTAVRGPSWSLTAGHSAWQIHVFSQASHKGPASLALQGFIFLSSGEWTVPSVSREGRNGGKGKRLENYSKYCYLLRCPSQIFCPFFPSSLTFSFPTLADIVIQIYSVAQRRRWQPLIFYYPDA